MTFISGSNEFPSDIDIPDVGELNWGVVLNNALSDLADRTVYLKTEVEGISITGGSGDVTQSQLVSVSADLETLINANSVEISGLDVRIIELSSTVESLTGNGDIYISDILDVSGSPSDGDVLTYDSGTSTWQPHPADSMVDYISGSDFSLGINWVDGSPLYRVVAPWESTFPNSSAESQDLSGYISGSIDTVVDLKLLLKTTSGNQQMIASNQSSAGTADEKITISTGTSWQWNSPFNRTSGLSSAYVIMDFTKA